jgi:ribosomal-protein-alanine N-acetyltransferase
MRREDTDQVVEIDKEAFPTQWPPTNYRNELQNRLAHYVVVYKEEESIKAKPQPLNTDFFSRIRKWLTINRKTPDESSREDFIVGFAGCWILADETHITEIATRKLYRGQGIGQLLIMTLIEMGVELKANLATLEVRVSNTAAQRLYEKFGFEKVGTRKGYYTDNHEDALIMTISDIRSPAFQERLGQIKRNLVQKWGLSYFPVMQTEPSKRY